MQQRYIENVLLKVPFNKIKTYLLLLFLAISFTNCTPKPTIQQEIINTDIINFWDAYDKVSTTKDTILQLKYINEFFINKASKGQKGMIKARNYEPK